MIDDGLSSQPRRRRDSPPRHVHVAAAAPPRLASAAATRLREMSTSQPRRRRDSPPGNVHVAAAAPPRLASRVRSRPQVDRFAGGRAVLFSAGFQLAHRSAGGGGGGGDDAADGGDSDESSSSWVVWESFLILREPNPLADGFDAWTAWFDNLKACHARLADEATRVGAATADTGRADGVAPAWVDTKRSLY